MQLRLRVVATDRHFREVVEATRLSAGLQFYDSLDKALEGAAWTAEEMWRLD